MAKFIICVKGISGSGKSTRTYLVLKFLRDVLGYETEPLMLPQENGKEKQCGILVKGLDIVFLGKEYETGGVARFQGLDAVTGAFGSNAAISDFLKANSKKYSFFLEGAGTTQSHRFRPKFLYEYCEFTDIMIQYYNYGGDEFRQEYLDRIFYRSGKVPNKATMWDKEHSYMKEVGFSKREIEEVGDKCFSIMFDDKFNSNVYDLGLKYFGIFHEEDLSASYKKFVEGLDYIKLNSFENFNS